MKTLLTTLTAASLGITSFAALAQSPEIVVQPERVPPSLVTQVSNNLDRNLERSLSFYDFSSSKGGIVQVAFETDANGEPTDASFYRKSDNPRLDRVAMRSVRKLSSIDGRGRNQRYLANIIVATNWHEMQELKAELAASERARIASNTPAATYVAVGFNIESPGG